MLCVVAVVLLFTLISSSKTLSKYLLQSRSLFEERRTIHKYFQNLLEKQQSKVPAVNVFIIDHEQSVYTAPLRLLFCFWFPVIYRGLSIAPANIERLSTVFYNFYLLTIAANRYILDV